MPLDYRLNYCNSSEGSAPLARFLLRMWSDENIPVVSKGYLFQSTVRVSTNFIRETNRFHDPKMFF